MKNKIPDWAEASRSLASRLQGGSKLLLTKIRIGTGPKKYLFVDRVRSQVERRIASDSSSLYVASYGVVVFELPRSNRAIKNGNGIYLKANG